MEKNKIFLVMAMAIMGLLFTSYVSANPVINAEISNYDPVPLVPGRTAEVWVSFQNLGGEIARNIDVEFVDTSAFKLVSENDRKKSIPLIGAQGEYLIKYSVRVSENAVDGMNDFILKYTLGSIGGGQFEKKLLLEVKSTEVPITISSVRLDPETISPGSKSTLKLSIRNLAQSSSIKDVTVNLGLTPIYSQTMILYDLPFVPVGSASQKTIGTIGPGQTTDVSFEIAAYPDAESQIYKVPVMLSFKDDSGTSYNKSVLIGIEVNSKPDIVAMIDGATINSKMNVGDVNFEITNRGLTGVKLMTVTLMQNDGFEILNPSNQVYVGNIDSDDFETARFSIRAKNTDKIVFPLKIEYRDSLNNRFEQEFNIEYVMRAPVGNGGGYVWIIIVVIIIIIAAIVIIRKRKKKNQRRTQ